jgi:hypothetical protein
VPQYKAPISVVDDSRWDKNGEATAVECTDDRIDSPDDAGYVSNSGGDALRFKMDLADHPNRTDGLSIKARARSADMGPDMTLRLYQGVTNIVDVGGFGLSSDFEDKTYTLSDAEALSITDYADLYVEVECAAQMDVSVVELEVADRTLHAYVIG